MSSVENTTLHCFQGGIDKWADFIYPFNMKHLPYRTVWSWYYQNPKYRHHPTNYKGLGRDVDVIVRSIRNNSDNNPIKTIHQFLSYEGTASASELGKKAVALLYPNAYLGKVIWYNGERVDEALV